MQQGLNDDGWNAGFQNKKPTNMQVDRAACRRTNKLIQESRLLLHAWASHQCKRQPAPTSKNCDTSDASRFWRNMVWWTRHEHLGEQIYVTSSSIKSNRSRHKSILLHETLVCRQPALHHPSENILSSIASVTHERLILTAPIQNITNPRNTNITTEIMR